MIVNENLCKENYKFEVEKTKSDWESIGIYFYCGEAGHTRDNSGKFKDFQIVEGEEPNNIYIPPANVENKLFYIGGGTTPKSKVSNFQHLCQGGGLC